MSALKETQEEEVFEIVDFTTASEWERFIASVEEILHDWQLSGCDQRDFIKGNFSTADWQEQSVSLKFADVSFSLSHHFRSFTDSEERGKELIKDKGNNENDEAPFPPFLVDMFNLENDFPARAHCLMRWFGVSDFVTLIPENPSHNILSPSKAKLLLSSLGIAANNTQCFIPMFVQLGNVADKVYMGIGHGCGIRTDFEMCYVKTPPPQCTHLSGLLDMFKSKIGSTLTSDPAIVSVHFTYILSEWPHHVWTQQPPDFDMEFSDIGFSELGSLPFGAVSDPIGDLQLSTTWPCLSEHEVVDTEVQSDLHPSSASVWSAHISSSLQACLLSEYLLEFLNTSSNERSIVEILGHEFDPNLHEDSRSITNALDRLTSSPVPSLSSFMSGMSPKEKNSHLEGPIPDNVLSLFLNFLFPDAQSLQEENAEYPETSSFCHVPPWNLLDTGVILRSIKTCAVNSFLWRLAIVLCHAINCYGGISGAAHLYYEILMEFRFRWDNGILIPGVGEGVPDLATCLFYQKLQMVNCCIRHKLHREQTSSSDKSNITMDEEDEFFECNDSEMEAAFSIERATPSWDKPEGRLRPLGNERLLNIKEVLYIPITQEAAPVTDDLLEEQTDELLSLGSDSYGSNQRARLMSSALLSDMESFKAANPGSILEDFVRWYSPRDWIEEEISNEGETILRHRLSDRMKIEGNLWQEVWNDAKPVPARRQKRLFDDTREAEKVLHWFSYLSPGRLCLQLLPVIMHVSLCRLSEELVLYTLPATVSDMLPSPPHNDTLLAQLQLLAQRVVRLSRQPSSIPQFKSLFEQVRVIEWSIAKAQSLRVKLLGNSHITSGSLKNHSHSEEEVEPNVQNSELSTLESLVSKLLHQPEVILENGPSGLQAAAILKLFAEGKNSNDFEGPSTSPSKKEKMGPEKWDYRSKETSRDSELGKPFGREYLLRANAAFPADYSRVLPHRLYAVIMKNSFRMAGSITHDTLFC